MYVRLSVIFLQVVVVVVVNVDVLDAVVFFLLCENERKSAELEMRKFHLFLLMLSKKNATGPPGHLSLS